MQMIEFISLTNAEQVRFLTMAAPERSWFDRDGKHFFRTFSFGKICIRQTISTERWRTTLIEVFEPETFAH